MRNRSWIVLGTLLCWNISLSTMAQSIVTNIAFARRETTNAYYPDSTAQYYIVQGRISSPNLTTNTGSDFFIQDTNDNVGINVRNLGVTLDTNTFQVGREMTVQGLITQSNGLRAIVPEFGADMTLVDATAIPVTPLLGTVTDLLLSAETYESRLVTITNVVCGKTWPSYGYNLTTAITDVTASIALRIDSDTDIVGQLPPTNAFDIKGVFSQYDLTGAANSGYQIVPRSYGDIIQKVGLEPPQIAVVSNITAFINTAIGVNAVAQDRNAGDVLTMTMTQAPAAATLVQAAARLHHFAWTPSATDFGTTNVTLEVTDGVTTNTATIRINVRNASGGPGYGWVNEFHYDNVGTDTNEGVEVAGQSGIDLSAYSIIIYNSSGNIVSSNPCSGTIDDEGHGYGAVWFPISGIPNTPPGGIALFHNTNGLLQFLSYEGTITPTSGPAAGVTSVDTGVKENPAPPVGQSLQLQGNGTNYEAFSWSGPMTATMGDLNGSGQIIIGPANAKLTYSGLSLSPAKPSPGAAFNIESLIVPNYSASNLTPTAYYRINTGSWNSIAMAVIGGYTNRTSSSVPAQTNGTPIDYYVTTTFDGPNAPSPTVSATNSYVIASYPPTIAPVTNKTVQVSNLVAFVVSATEPDGNLITLTASNLPANAAFYPTNGVSASSGSFVFTPDASQGGNVYTALFYAVDADGAGWTSVVITVNFSGYLVDFEDATKTSYTSNNVTLNGKLWSMSESLIGNSTADRKYGLQSSRTRYAGRIMMLEDKTSGCGQITFKYAKYGTDAASTGRVEYSTDGGNAWTQAGADFVATTTDPMQDFSATVNITNNVRIRITKLAPTNNSARFNVDNILIADYSAPTYQDGIPVAWWERYGLGSTNTAANDNDGDGRSNWEEFIADSNPTNSSSFFPTSTTNISGKATMILYAGPPTTNSRVYDAWWNTDLVSGAWTPYNFNVQGNADGSAVALTVTNSTGLRFYQTGVKMLP